MARIELRDRQICVDMENLFEKLMALKSTLSIPVEHVVGMRAHPLELRDQTFIFKVFGASLFETHVGYFWKKGEGLVFADIHNLAEVLAVDLKEERMKHLYLQVTDESAEHAMARIKEAWQAAGLGELPTEVTPMNTNPLPDNAVGLA